MTQPLSKGSKVFVVGFAAFVLWGVYQAGRNDPRTPPGAHSLEDMILHYGGCNEYRQAVHDALVIRDAPLVGLPEPSYDDLAIASAERKLWEAKTAAACRKMGNL
jgi:hypothetical protein